MESNFHYQHVSNVQQSVPRDLFFHGIQIPIPAAQSAGPSYNTINEEWIRNTTASTTQCLLCTRKFSIHSGEALQLPLLANDFGMQLGLLVTHMKITDFCQNCLKNPNSTYGQQQANKLSILLTILSQLEEIIRKFKDKVNLLMGFKQTEVSSIREEEVSVDTGGDSNSLFADDSTTQEDDNTQWSTETNSLSAPASEDKLNDEDDPDYQVEDEQIRKSKKSRKPRTKKKVNRSVPTKLLPGQEDGLLPNQCHICKKVLSGKTHLDNHLLIHSNEKPHECKYCKKRFRHLPALFIHSKRHTGDLSYKCTICGKGFVSKWHRDTHAGSHTSKLDRELKFQCHLCPNSYALKPSFLHHLKNAHPETRDPEKYGPEKIPSCSFCQKTFLHPSMLNTHVLNNHTPELKQHQCELCGNTFDKEGGLRRHKKEVHTDFKRKDYHKKKKSDRKIGRPPKVVEATIDCPDCERKFAEHRHLKYHCKKVHQKIVESEKEKSKPISCPDCGKRFFHSSSLKRHSKSSHQKTTTTESKMNTENSNPLESSIDKEKSFSCLDCDRKFAEHRHLKYHCKKKHQKIVESEKEKSKPISCPVCGKRFLYLRSLKRHSKSSHQKTTTKESEMKTQDSTPLENNEKPFSCDECGTKFINSDSLKRHAKKFHNKSTTLECKICKKKLSARSLKDHMETHVHSGADRFKKYESLRRIVDVNIQRRKKMLERKKRKNFENSDSESSDDEGDDIEKKWDGITQEVKIKLTKVDEDPNYFKILGVSEPDEVFVKVELTEDKEINNPQVQEEEDPLL